MFHLVRATFFVLRQDFFFFFSFFFVLFFVVFFLNVSRGLSAVLSLCCIQICVCRDVLAGPVREAWAALRLWRSGGADSSERGGGRHARAQSAGRPDLLQRALQRRGLCVYWGLHQREEPGKERLLRQ